MKIKYVIVAILIILLITGGIFLWKKAKEKEKINKIENGELISLYFSYSKGYMMNSNVRYEFSYDKEINRYKVGIKPYGVSEEEKLEKEIDESLKDKLKEVLVKYEVVKWDGFDKNDSDVLDGDGFSFSARFKDDTSISASGYMMWPDNYRNVCDELDTIFMEIYNKEKGRE